MNKININSQKSFKYGIAELVLLLILITLSLTYRPSVSDVYSLLIGVLVFVIGFLSTLGLIYALKSIKEPNTLKKIIGMLINFSMFLLFVSIIIANIFDVYSALK